LAFSSLGVDIDRSIYGPSGVYTFRIHGELIHQIGSLLLCYGQQPRFSQIYIYDSDSQHQAEMRMSYHHRLLNKSIVLQLQQMLQLYNPYIDIFITASERLALNENISLRLKTVNTKYLNQSRRYNHPAASEIAIIMPGTGEEQADRRDIVLQGRNGQLQRISELHSAYCALRYPLLFPNGQQGWHPNMMSNDWYLLLDLYSFAEF